MTTSRIPGTVESNGFELSALHRLQEIESLIEKLVASWHRADRMLQTRRWHRAGFEKPLALTPLDEITEKPIGDPLPASGRNVSVHGIAFSHLDPLPYRKIAITFPDENDIQISVVTYLKWCRFTRKSVYHSGGRFIRTIELLLPEDFEFLDLFCNLRSL